jgi:hypothetical protein
MFRRFPGEGLPHTHPPVCNRTRRAVLGRAAGIHLF